MSFFSYHVSCQLTPCFKRQFPKFLARFSLNKPSFHLIFSTFTLNYRILFEDTSYLVHVLKDRGWQNLLILWLKDSLTDESIIKLIDRLAD